MGAYRPILINGDALKKEKKLITGPVVPGTFVKVSGAGVVAAPAESVGQTAIVDYTGANGVNWTGTTYVTGDQIPVIYPTNGCEVNVLVDPASAAIAVGDNIAVGAGGKAGKAASVAVAVGVALEAAAIPANGGKILMEVLK